MKKYLDQDNLCTLEKIICDTGASCQNCQTAKKYAKKVRRDRARQTTLVFSGALVTLITVVTPASAVSGVGDIVYDPENYVQNVESAVQAAKQVTNQYQQIQNQFQQLANEARHLQSDVTNIQGLKTAYRNLINVQRYMNNLVSDYTKAQAAWDRTYPDFARMNRVSASTYGAQAYNAWNASKASAQNAKVATAAARQNSQLTQAQVDLIIARSDNAQGALQAAQLGNKMAYAQSQQLQQLVCVVTESTEAQSDFIMQQNRAKEAAKKQLEEEDWDTSDLPSLENPGSGVGYPVMGK
jgi:P-type conjugative transfer protein TrbJ